MPNLAASNEAMLVPHLGYLGSNLPNGEFVPKFHVSPTVYKCFRRKTISMFDQLPENSKHKCAEGIAQLAKCPT